MKPICQPVSMRQPEIGALVAGEMSVLIRPLGRLVVLDPGDLLWVREPFHLPKAFSAYRPSTAATLGAVPVFVADHEPRWLQQRVDELGRARLAREMPKAWHRQHLRVTNAGLVKLREVGDADLRAAGWALRSDFRRRWDQDVAFGGKTPGAANMWDADPMVLRIGFELVATPLPGFDPRSCANSARAARRSRAEGGAAPTSTPFRRSLPEPDRSPCSRCGVRRDRGCDHHPLAVEAAL